MVERGGAARQTIAENNTALRGTPQGWCCTGGGEETRLKGRVFVADVSGPHTAVKSKGRQRKEHNLVLYLQASLQLRCVGMGATEVWFRDGKKTTMPSHEALENFYFHLYQ